MDATKAHAILCNIAVICVGTMALGLVISWWLRRDLTTAGLSMQGKVKTDPYHIMDLGAAALLIILHLSPLIAVATLTPEAAEATQPAENESKGVSIHSAISLAFFSLVLGICVFVFASVLRGRKPGTVFGLSCLSPIRILCWAVLAVLVAYPLMIGFALLQKMFFDPGEELQKVVKILLESDNNALRIVLIISATMVAPLVEEIIFRGYLYAVIKRYSGCVFAAITTSLLFAVVHGNLPGMLPLFILALILTLAYELTGCLWVPIVAHSLFNLFNISQMYLIQNG
jgi:membrane protease YdiL (CAAX protease family)